MTFSWQITTVNSKEFPVLCDHNTGILVLCTILV
jgi:hypothetical protein